jgi:hypothetical protein
MRYEESFVVYLDFLGFSEASRELNDSDRQRVLGLLTTLAGLRSDFWAAITEQKDGNTTFSIRPAISTFSDHIIISYGLESLRESTRTETTEVSIAVLSQVRNLAAFVAAAALRIGFLVRGAATVGKLYHVKGVVFGEALVEVTQLESRTAVYPRIILSPSARRAEWMKDFVLLKDYDGIHCINYVQQMLWRSSQGAQQGDEWTKNVKKWLSEVVPLVHARLQDYERAGRLNELAKWSWFARQFRAELGKFSDMLDSLEMPLASIPWGQ